MNIYISILSQQSATNKGVWLSRRAGLPATRAQHTPLTSSVALDSPHLFLRYFYLLKESIQ